eukprot:3302454-Rhodomonas_salina.1
MPPSSRVPIIGPMPWRSQSLAKECPAKLSTAAGCQYPGTRVPGYTVSGYRVSGYPGMKQFEARPAEWCLIVLEEFLPPWYPGAQIVTGKKHEVRRIARARIPGYPVPVP